MSDKTVHEDLSLPFRRRQASILSPLRYPGAKRRLSSYIAETLRLNSLRPKLLVEPFAGGLSVALQLLNDNMVDMIAIGEKDPLVASFWKVVFKESEWLIDELSKVPVTVEQWDYFKKTPFRTDRQRALACIFLNRTSFSGIIAPGAGPIGGRSQTSDYKIDCRFNVETLAKRIRQAAALSKNVLFVDQADWQETILKVKALEYKRNEVFFYLDPPFFNKAEDLYTHYFDNMSHRALHNALMKLKHPWLLSYDKADSIIEMYSHNGDGPKHIDTLYSVGSSGSRPKTQQEVIITNVSILPKETRIWRSDEEWKK